MPVIKDSTPNAIDLRAAEYPLTITVNTTYASKLIQLSLNDDQSLPFTPTYNTSNASQIAVVVDAPVAWAFITGQNGDSYNIRTPVR